MPAIKRSRVPSLDPSPAPIAPRQAATGREASPSAASVPPAARDLRTALLAASRALLDEQGPAGLSLREVARRTGCTHQAPYHHFADRESILAALVEQGFDELADRMTRANDSADAMRGAAPARLRAALHACGAAYVAFASEHPGVFRIMFRPDHCDPARFPAVRAAGDRAHGQLLRLAARLGGEPSVVPIDATVLWAHVHGMACLLVDGPLAASLSDPAARERHLAAVQQRFVEGVMASSGSRDPSAPLAG